MSTSRSQYLEAGLGGAGAARALEGERPGDDADGEDALGARRPGDDRRGAGAGAAAHAGGDEAHVRALEHALDVGERFLGGGAAQLGARAGAEALGGAAAELDDAVGRRIAQRLRVGVGGDELDAAHVAAHHVGDRIAAGAADADHADPRPQFLEAPLRHQLDHLPLLFPR